MSQGAQKNKLPPFDASEFRVGIVVAQFNADITDALLESALQAAKQFKIPEKNITIHRVAGSIEIPVILKTLAEHHAPGGGRYEALVALGAIIRGETDHYEYVAKIVSEGVRQVMLDDIGIPIGFSVLTCDTEAQARARLNIGADALAAALHSAKIIRDVQST